MSEWSPYPYGNDRLRDLLEYARFGLLTAEELFELRCLLGLPDMMTATVKFIGAQIQ